MLYAIGSESGNMKIGITESLDVRFNAIQTGNPEKLYLYQYWELGSREADKMAETQLHWQLARYRQNGEWFHLSPQGVDWLVRRVASDFVGREQASQVRFADAPLAAKETKPFRLSKQFLWWIDDITGKYSNRTETMERLAALPPAEREAIACMLDGSWNPRQEEPHSFGEMLKWDSDLAAILDKHPEMKSRIENVVLAEQSYLCGNGLPSWIGYEHPLGGTNGPIYEQEFEIEREPIYD